MPSHLRDRPRLTPKGERTRALIVDVAAHLMYDHGVVGTTLDEVRSAAEVSGSQLSHYFADKNQLVQAVIDHRADTVVTNQRTAELGTVEGLRAWRDMVIEQAQLSDARGGCPLGSLGGQLAESNAPARELVAAGFERWSAALADGLRNLGATGQLPDRIDPDDLAITLLAVLQGGLLLAQVQRDIRPLETALDTILALVTKTSRR